MSMIPEWLLPQSSFRNVLFVVEDNSRERGRIAKAFQSSEYDVVAVDGLKELCTYIKKNHINILGAVLDATVPDGDIEDLAQVVEKSFSHVPVYVISCNGKAAKAFKDKENVEIVGRPLLPSALEAFREKIETQENDYVSA